MIIQNNSSTASLRLIILVIFLLLCGIFLLIQPALPQQSTDPRARAAADCSHVKAPTSSDPVAYQKYLCAYYQCIETANPGTATTLITQNCGNIPSVQKTLEIAQPTHALPQNIQNEAGISCPTTIRAEDYPGDYEKYLSTYYCCLGNESQKAIHCPKFQKPLTSTLLSQSNTIIPPIVPTPTTIPAVAPTIIPIVFPTATIAQPTPTDIVIPTKIAPTDPPAQTEQHAVSAPTATSTLTPQIPDAAPTNNPILPTNTPTNTLQQKQNPSTTTPVLLNTPAQVLQKTHAPTSTPLPEYTRVPIAQPPQQPAITGVNLPSNHLQKVNYLLAKGRPIVFVTAMNDYERWRDSGYPGSINTSNISGVITSGEIKDHLDRQRFMSMTHEDVIATRNFPCFPECQFWRVEQFVSAGNTTLDAVFAHESYHNIQSRNDEQLAEHVCFYCSNRQSINRAYQAIIEGSASVLNGGAATGYGAYMAFFTRMRQWCNENSCEAQFDNAAQGNWDEFQRLVEMYDNKEKNFDNFLIQLGL